MKKELPDEIKNLYRHWNFHKYDGSSENYEQIPKEIRWFIKERINIWKKKISKENPPHTEDPILAKYRFCNIFRELDKQTIIFHTLLNPLRNDFSLWLLNMFYCRMVARPETINSIGLLSFDKKQNKKLYEKLIRHQRPKFGTPYVFPISVIQKSETPTRELFIVNYLPKIIKPIAEEIQSWNKESVFDGLNKIMPIFKFNLKFLWTEVLIDTAYQFPKLIDLFKKFPIGPGAKPTFKKLDKTKDASEFVKILADKNIATEITFNKSPLKLSAENWEGIGC